MQRNVLKTPFSALICSKICVLPARQTRVIGEGGERGDSPGASKNRLGRPSRALEQSWCAFGRLFGALGGFLPAFSRKVSAPSAFKSFFLTAVAAQPWKKERRTSFLSVSPLRKPYFHISLFSRFGPLFDAFCSLLATIFLLLGSFLAPCGWPWGALGLLSIALGRLFGGLGRRLGVSWVPLNGFCNAFWPHVAQKADQ